jgi:hypothetical protein
VRLGSIALIYSSVSASEVSAQSHRLRFHDRGLRTALTHDGKLRRTGGHHPSPAGFPLPIESEPIFWGLWSTDCYSNRNSGFELRKTEIALRQGRVHI